MQVRLTVVVVYGRSPLSTITNISQASPLRIVHHCYRLIIKTMPIIIGGCIGKKRNKVAAQIA